MEKFRYRDRLITLFLIIGMFGLASCTPINATNATRTLTTQEAHEYLNEQLYTISYGDQQFPVYPCCATADNGVPKTDSRIYRYDLAYNINSNTLWTIGHSYIKTPAEFKQVLTDSLNSNQPIKVQEPNGSIRYYQMYGDISLTAEDPNDPYGKFTYTNGKDTIVYEAYELFYYVLNGFESKDTPSDPPKAPNRFIFQICDGPNDVNRRFFIGIELSSIATPIPPSIATPIPPVDSTH